MRIQISIVNLKGNGLTKIIEVDTQIGIKNFIKLIELEDWGTEVVENGMIKPPYTLIINDKLVLMKESPQFTVGDEDTITFAPLLSGG